MSPDSRFLGLPAPLSVLPRSTGWGETPEAAFQRLSNITQEQFLTALVQGRIGDLSESIAAKEPSDGFWGRSIHPVRQIERLRPIRPIR